MTWKPEEPTRTDVRKRVDALDESHAAREAARRPRAWTIGVVWLALIAIALLALVVMLR